tara:strand:+ start:1355 stop:1516 length:162 start_codon:yes stop_codon:yes gene_type:complete
MSNNIVNSKAKRVAIEYAGLGAKPFFVITTDNGVKFIPIERGITQLSTILEEE